GVAGAAAGWSKRSTALLHGIPLGGGQADLDEGVVLGGMAGGTGGPQRLDALLEKRGVLLLDGVDNLGKGAFEEEIVGIGFPGRTALQPEPKRALQRHGHVGGGVPVAVRAAPRRR